MPEKAQLHWADPSPGQQPTVQKARLSDVNEMFRIVNYYAERQQMLPKTQLQLYENLRDYSIVVGTSNAACFSQTCCPGSAGVSPADCYQSPSPGKICATGLDTDSLILEPPGRRRSQDENHAAFAGTSAPNRLLGCGALHIYWEDLAEIRALAVAPEMTHKGVGTALVERLLDEARELEIERVFLFTYEPRFFARFGFIQVEHRTMPLKVYNECFHCPKFNKCDELAMVLHI
jgi:amino-acid N-acetyltransferase